MYIKIVMSNFEQGYMLQLSACKFEYVSKIIWLSLLSISPLYINGKLPFFVSKERFENGVNKLVFSCLVDSSQIIIVKGNYKMSKGGLLWDY